MFNSEGVRAHWVQGPDFASTVYYGNGITGYARGNRVDVELRRAGTETVTVQGARLEETLHKASSEYAYQITGAVTGAYYAGSRVQKRGTQYQGKLYDADGELIPDKMYFGDGGYVTTVGDEVTGAYTINTTPVKVQGEAYGGELRLPGTRTVTVQGEEFTDTVFDATGSAFRDRGSMVTVPLFGLGTEVPGGLFKNFVAAQIETQDVRVLGV